MTIDINVLVVDDNKSDLLIFTESLEEIENSLKSKNIFFNFIVTKALDGSEAIKILKKNNFDIIFLDIKMPKVDGIETLDYIKNNNINSYIVMFTTSDYKDDVEKSFKLGANGYLLKSLNLSEFEEDLRSVVIVFLQKNVLYMQFKKNKQI